MRWRVDTKRGKFGAMWEMKLWDYADTVFYILFPAYYRNRVLIREVYSSKSDKCLPCETF